MGLSPVGTPDGRWCGPTAPGREKGHRCRDTLLEVEDDREALVPSRRRAPWPSLGSELGSALSGAAAAASSVTRGQPAQLERQAEEERTAPGSASAKGMVQKRLGVGPVRWPVAQGNRWSRGVLRAPAERGGDVPRQWLPVTRRCDPRGWRCLSPNDFPRFTGVVAGFWPGWVGGGCCRGGSATGRGRGQHWLVREEGWRDGSRELLVGDPVPLPCSIGASAPGLLAVLQPRVPAEGLLRPRWLRSG